MADSDNILFTNVFTVTDIDKEGKKFDKVSRMTGYAQNEAIEVHLDYACELYQFKTGAKAHIALARSLDTGVSGSADGGREAKREMWRGGEQGLAEDYDYVMYGKIYKFDESRKGDSQTTAYLSFGGLLMAIRGSYRSLANLVIGENVYLLVK
ncbi:DNA-directed RNA polymerases I, II, and III subunit RPABC3 [Naganishia albida]|nr:DNA-directed RNA polymerases I, II, and III subunit RPABC3 [Naganishia albida]